MFYKGYWCDSSWELAYVIYNLEHNIKFERNKQGFEYEFENKKYKYYPDFILEDGTYVEVDENGKVLKDGRTCTIQKGERLPATSAKGNMWKRK